MEIEPESETQIETHTHTEKNRMRGGDRGWDGKTGERGALASRRGLSLAESSRK